MHPSDWNVRIALLYYILSDFNRRAKKQRVYFKLADDNSPKGVRRTKVALKVKYTQKKT